MAVQLRPATLDDRDAIVEVFLACWRLSYRGVLPQTAIDEMTDERAGALWTRVLASPTGTVLVAERDRTVLGITRFETAGDTGAVHSLYVSPDARGLGLGSLLLTTADERLRDAGAQATTLWVFAANAPSIAFYGARGWSADGQTRTQDEFGVPELRLRRSHEADA